MYSIFSKFHTQIFFYFACIVNMCVGAYRCVCMCTWRLMPDVFLNHSLYIKMGSLTWAQSLHLGFPYLCLLHAGIRGGLSCLACVYMSSLDLNSTSQVCTEDLFPTEPSTNGPHLWLNFYLQRHKVYNRHL